MLLQVWVGCCVLPVLVPQMRLILILSHASSPVCRILRSIWAPLAMEVWLPQVDHLLVFLQTRHAIVLHVTLATLIFLLFVYNLFVNGKFPWPGKTLLTSLCWVCHVVFFTHQRLDWKIQKRNRLVANITTYFRHICALSMELQSNSPFVIPCLIVFHWKVGDGVAGLASGSGDRVMGRLLFLLGSSPSPSSSCGGGWSPSSSCGGGGGGGGGICSIADSLALQLDLLKKVVAESTE